MPDALTPQDLGSILDASFDIAVRPGSALRPYIHRASAPFPTARSGISPGPFTTAEQIAGLLRALDEITAGVLWPGVLSHDGSPYVAMGWLCFVDSANRSSPHSVDLRFDPREMGSFVVFTIAACRCNLFLRRFFRLGHIGFDRAV